MAEDKNKIKPKRNVYQNTIKKLAVNGMFADVFKVIEKNKEEKKKP